MSSTSTNSIHSTQNRQKASSYGDPDDIINGGVLPQGVRPYLVELRQQLPPGDTRIFPDTNLTFHHSCGGSLIGRQTVLTAARKFIQEHILFLFNIFIFSFRSFANIIYQIALPI